ncbi:T9SS type A sorting domain-containing protein, partial [uncultured Psychroserpens sp.]|uniref:T9SS type A sorting domain-containing protein n=1 Tax=uncultured Psychroserpens sp. TaxID=255436 RepID=UPI002613284A
GWAISLSSDGSIVAIGAQANDGNGNNSGHVRVYENQSGTWVQLGQDIDGEALGDQSGRAISLSSNGSILAIGAIYNDANGNNSGHVRIYENQGGTWVQLGQDIDGESTNTQLGRSVSLSSDGSKVAIGVLSIDITGIFNSGEARIYENQGNNWVQVGQTISSVGDFSGFGLSVSLSSDGSIVAIGAIEQDINNPEPGYVSIYKNQSGTWVQVGQDIDGEANGDQSGYSVSLSSDGSIVGIGAPLNDGNIEFSGHVRVYSIASELALLEVIDDITGNINGINITADQLNNIAGVSGAIEGVNYTTALDNGTFVDENNPTAAEIQLIIDQVNATLSTQDDHLIGFKLYPNPAKNQFSIQLNTSVQLEKVTVYNTLGQKVLISEEPIVNTSKLTRGTYIVEIMTNKGKTSKKLIIE